MFLVVSNFFMFKVFISLFINKINKEIYFLNNFIWLNIVCITINIWFLVIDFFYSNKFLYFINENDINII